MDKNKENVPKIRFPGFTDPWEQRKVGELADIVRGASPRPIQDPKWFDIESEVGWLRISDVTEQDGRIYHLEQRISKLGQQKTRVLNEPHLLLSIAATVGKPVINYVKTGVHDGFLIFLKPKFDREFMFQWLEMFRPMWQRYGQPGSQVNLNSDLVKNQEIALPSIEEQVVIGEFLSQFDNLITLHQSKLKHLQDKKKGLLQKMFPKEGEKFPEIRFPGFTEPWEQRKLGEECQITMGQSPDGSTYTEEPSDYILIQGNADLKDGWVEPRVWTTQKTKTASIGDLIMSVRAPAGSMGKTAYNGVIGRGVAAIKGNEFIYQLLNKMDKEGYWKKFSCGSTFESLNSENIKNAEILMPGTEEQVKLGEYFLKIDNLITLHKRKLEHLRQQKKGLLQQMFV